ncbi:DNA polymerase IV [Gardnerella vaginalis]|uniref:DNA polymerase IV n=1 Tax=Gardnerella vaginalis TaxID=2702 RepID=UPI001FF5A88C|nr:DNA polymerase IV [Gardnerella vaginalis]
MSTAPRVQAAKRDWGHDTSGCNILHVDMDAFYASLEVARHPDLKGKPLIIGTGNRAVVSAASYEARAYGVNSAIPVVKARTLCPQGVFLPVDIPYYSSVSKSIFEEIFLRVTNQVEKVSVDECYMNVKSALLQWKSPVNIGAWIRKEVFEKYHITCSVGIASNKLIAKMASTNAKPNGMLLIPQKCNEDFVSIMPLRAIPGIGPSLIHKLEDWGLSTVTSLKNVDEKTLARITGSQSMSRMIYQSVRGIDERTVIPRAPEKSIGTERTLDSDTTSEQTVQQLLQQCCSEVTQHLRNRKLMARTITLKLRFSDLHYVTRSSTLQNATDSTHEFYKHAIDLLSKANPTVHNYILGGNNTKLLSPVRLAGITANNLVPANKVSLQPSLNDILEENTRESKNPAQNSISAMNKNTRLRHAEHALDAVRKKYGDDAAHIGL